MFCQSSLANGYTATNEDKKIASLEQPLNFVRISLQRYSMKTCFSSSASCPIGGSRRPVACTMYFPLLVVKTLCPAPARVTCVPMPRKVEPSPKRRPIPRSPWVTAEMTTTASIKKYALKTLWAERFMARQTYQNASGQGEIVITCVLYHLLYETMSNASYFSSCSSLLLCLCVRVMPCFCVCTLLLACCGCML